MENSQQPRKFSVVRILLVVLVIAAIALGIFFGRQYYHAKKYGYQHQENWPVCPDGDTSAPGPC